VKVRPLAPLAALLAASCATSAPKPPAGADGLAAQGASLYGGQSAEVLTAHLVAAEDRAVGWLVAADPRLAARFGAKAPDDILNQIGTEAVLAEDAAASIHDGALDLFGFRARSLAIEHAAKEASQIPAALPGILGPESPVTRPALERELLVRVIDEERARVADEASLGPASGDLVRGILSTWKTPNGDDAWRARDAWAATHLLAIADSLRAQRTVGGPSDLDEVLYPLERLLAPLEFPKASAALARVRMALDDARGVPALWSAESIAGATRSHLGTAVDVASLKVRLAGVREQLRGRALTVLAGAGGGRDALEARARNLLFVEGSCPAGAGSRIRAAAPPPERAVVCGWLGAASDAASRDAAVVALYDDVSLALAAFDPAPPPRTGLLSRPDNDRVDALRRAARERPVVAVGLAMAAVILYEDPAAADARTRSWASLGDAPLDIVAREIGAPVRP
jgi:hypothetical protein